MSYSDDFNIRTTNVKFNDVADAIDGTITRMFGSVTTGTSAAYVANPLPYWTEYASSAILIIIPHVNNIAAPTLTVNGLSAKPLVRGNVPLVAGTLKAGIPVLLVFSDNDNFETVILTNALLSDGSTVPGANLPMGGYRHTGVGDATARDQYAAMGQVQDGVATYLTAVAGTNTITATAPFAMSAYVTGQKFLLKIANTNAAGATTININSIGAKTIQCNGAALGASQLIANRIVLIGYDGTNFQLLGETPTPLYVDSTNGRVGVGTASPATPLHVVGNIYTTGRIGIATSSPSAPLSVQGTTSQSTDATALLLGGASNNIGAYMSLSAGNYNPIAENADIALIFSGGSINTGALLIAPYANTAGSGGVRIGSNGNTTVRGGASGATAFTATSIIAGCSSSNFRVDALASKETYGIVIDKYTADLDNKYILFRYNNAAAGAATAQAYIAGNGGASVAIYGLSDVRLKENIVPLAPQLDNILRLKPCTFDFKSGPKGESGFIAQEIQEVFPDMVRADELGYLSLMTLGRHDARLVKAIQELAARVAALEGK